MLPKISRWITGQRIWLSELEYFKSTIKWLIIATVLGIIVALIVTPFLLAVEAISTSVYSIPGYFLALPIVLTIVVLANLYLLPKHRALDTNTVLESILFRKKLSFLATLKLYILSILTLAGGGSLGKEAPPADTGAYTGSLLSRILGKIPWFNNIEETRLMVCGLSAGFASAFGTPLAGAIFGAELLHAGAITYTTMLPAIMAGIVAYHISTLLGVHYFRNPIYIEFDIREGQLIGFIALGLFLGILAFFIIYLFRQIKVIYKRWNATPLVKAFFTGMALIWLSTIAGQSILGIGFNRMVSILAGDVSTSTELGGKVVATVLTYGGGGCGGLVTPIMFIGSSAGSLFADILPVKESQIYAALGMVGLLSGVFNTPISASVLAMELFGMRVGVIASLVCFLSFVISGPHLLFSAQKWALPLSSLKK